MLKGKKIAILGGGNMGEVIASGFWPRSWFRPTPWS
jgi:pyrroline-5-carboxylate reductase